MYLPIQNLLDFNLNLFFWHLFGIHPCYACSRHLFFCFIFHRMLHRLLFSPDVGNLSCFKFFFKRCYCYEHYCIVCLCFVNISFLFCCRKMSWERIAGLCNKSMFSFIDTDERISSVLGSHTHCMRVPTVIS